jgi:hypothetical protein
VYHWKSFLFSPEDKEAFFSGVLTRQWAKEYPFLFDINDEKIALNQPSYHFFEWSAAIRIYEEIGYFCLIEKYQFKNHKQKNLIFRDLVNPDLYDFIVNRKNNIYPQAPDLFVYNNLVKDWFFCEVKGPKDEIRISQKEYFEMIERICKTEVKIIRFFRKIK